VETLKRWLIGFAAVFLLAGLIYLGPALSVVKGQEQTTFTDDFSQDSGNWQYFGSAYRDATNQTLVLTTSDYMTGGEAFFDVPIRGSFTASFQYKVGGGVHQGDGFVMFFYKQKFTQPNEGGGLGFSIRNGSELKPVPGYGIEFDGWQNSESNHRLIADNLNPPYGDPSENHVALIKDSVGNHLAWVDDQRIADNIWHQVTINVQPTTIQVYIDGDLVLEWSGTLDQTYDGFGFGAGTGAPGTNWHIIDDVSITAKELHTPTLTTTCISSVGLASFPVQIDGQLAFDCTGISNAPIQLSYSITGGNSWQDLTLVHTNSEGKYSAVWLLSVTGDYMLKATYKGGGDYLRTSITVNFSVAPCSDQSTFSVTSNSTLSQLYFDSENKTVSFSVSGASGSTGYINIYIPVSLINDISGLKIYVDNAQISYNTQALGDGWLLHATYHHSSHQVTVTLETPTDNHQTQSSTQPNQTPSTTQPNQTPTSTQPNQTPATTQPNQTSPATQLLSPNLDLVQTAILVVMGILAATAVIASVRFLTRKENPKSQQ